MSCKYLRIEKRGLTQYPICTKDENRDICPFTRYCNKRRSVVSTDSYFNCKKLQEKERVRIDE